MSEKIKYRKLYALGGSGKKRAFNIPLKESIRIGKREYGIVLKNDDKHGTYILLKNRKFPVEIVRSRQNKYEILFNDISYTFTIETPFSLRRKSFLSKSVKGKVSEFIKAPMPGKIIDIPVRENMTVSRGEAVVILEAMKMQNEIQATMPGIVKRIFVRADTNVMKDDVLVEIEPSAK
jgi:glutaconyl-CoA/methylmalonyl-CoA decarboxylase subunit gamma